MPRKAKERCRRAILTRLRRWAPEHAELHGMSPDIPSSMALEYESNDEVATAIRKAIAENDPSFDFAGLPDPAIKDVVQTVAEELREHGIVSVKTHEEMQRSVADVSPFTPHYWCLGWLFVYDWTDIHQQNRVETVYHPSSMMQAPFKGSIACELFDFDQTKPMWVTSTVIDYALHYHQIDSVSRRRAEGMKKEFWKRKWKHDMWSRDFMDAQGKSFKFKLHCMSDADLFDLARFLQLPSLERLAAFVRNTRFARPMFIMCPTCPEAIPWSVLLWPWQSSAPAPKRPDHQIYHGSKTVYGRYAPKNEFDLPARDKELQPFFDHFFTSCTPPKGYTIDLPFADFPLYHCNCGFIYWFPEEQEACWASHEGQFQIHREQGLVPGPRRYLAKS